MMRIVPEQNNFKLFSVETNHIPYLLKSLSYLRGCNLKPGGKIVKDEETIIRMEGKKKKKKR